MMDKFIVYSKFGNRKPLEINIKKGEFYKLYDMIHNSTSAVRIDHQTKAGVKTLLQK